MPVHPFVQACVIPGCGAPVSARGRCGAHATVLDQHRGLNSDRQHAALYTSARWRKLRRHILDEHLLCECDDCRGGLGRVRRAAVVHHRQAHGGDPTKFFDPANLLPMAKACHDAITGRNRRK